MRCVHEASLYDDNMFITLTYNNENLPADGSLNHRHFQLFMKRLRKQYPEKNIRFFMCGEYGDSSCRPHYHSCVFNLDMPDKLHYSNANNNPLYISEKLQALWPYGFSTIGEVNFETAAYVASYVTKKITGDKAEKHYQAVIEETGEIVQLKPEYGRMSNRRGIGYDWYQKYKKETYRDDNVIMRGKPMQPPKYYDNLYELEAESHLNEIKLQRKVDSLKHSCNNTTSRLRTREKFQTLRKATARTGTI